MTIAQLFRNFLFFLSASSAAIAFLYYYYYCSNYQVFSVAKINIPKIFSWAYINSERNLRYNWLRMHRARTDWRALLKPCSDQMALGTLKSGWGKVNTSSAITSYISYMDIQPSGQFSRIFIQTRTASGQDKTIGGDFWRVLFTGPASVAATVFDHQNGTYEAMALLVEPGNYSIRAYLEYSLCSGLRDPPENWFRVGNAQGTEQVRRILPVVILGDVIRELLQASVNLVFEVLPNQFSSGIDHLSTVQCSDSCRALWDGYGRWRKNVWLPYLTAANDHRSKNITTQQKLKPRKGTLWIFGDSLSRRFHASLLSKPLCKEVFASCNRTYGWTYPIPKEDTSMAHKLNDNFDFRPNIILEAIRNVLRNDTMKSPQSLFVLNLGLHYAININFTTYQKLIDDVIVLLLDREVELGSRAQVVWKTTTATYGHKAGRTSTKRRFYTEQRVRLFDAYAMSAMCKAGFKVLDVFPLTASYEPGTFDTSHYVDEVFSAAELELEKYARNAHEYKSTAVCIT